MTSEAHIFVDTNSFIQLRDFKDLRWSDLAPDAQTIILFVSPTVIDELDQHKSGTNKRRRDRARLALKLIDQASTSPEFRILLRDRNNVATYLAIANDDAPRWEDHPKLDRSRPDDRIVAEVLSHPSPASLLSHDSGPRIKSRLAGLNALQPPSDWLLPPEQTDDQRRLASLERDLEQARNAKPRISMSVDGMSQDGLLILPRIILPPLSPTTVNALTQMLVDRHPVKTVEVRSENRYIGLTQSYNLVSEFDANRYYEAYDKWRDNVSHHFANYHERMLDRSRYHDILVRIQNVGSISAKNVVVEVRAEGGDGLMPNLEAAEDIFGSLSPADPPKPPRAGSDYVMPHTLLSLHRPARPQDPTSFLWIKRPALGADYMSETCSDFRPERTSYRPIWVQIYSGDSEPMRLSISAGAEHHATLFAEVTLFIQEQELNWTDEALKLYLPDDVAEIINAMEKSS